MLQSMTGFGKAICELTNKKIVVEIKSLNSKQFDLSTRISSLYREKEMDIRNLLNQKVERGKVDFSLYVDNTGKEYLSRINRTVVKSYIEQIRDIAAEAGVELPSDWFRIVLRLPDALKNETEELDEDEWKIIEKAIQNALEQFLEFRNQEGAVLEQIFESKILRISELLSQIDAYETERVDKIKNRLIENLQSISDKFTYDANRLEQELIFYVEKIDVNEEKSRLKNHLDYFIETMEREKSAGKKLGFIAQEIGREINTLGSKSNHAEMQKLVVMMKDELEQIKEQVLNTL